MSDVAIPQGVLKYYKPVNNLRMARDTPPDAMAGGVPDRGYSVTFQQEFPWSVTEHTWTKYHVRIRYGTETIIDAEYQSPWRLKSASGLAVAKETGLKPVSGIDAYWCPCDEPNPPFSSPDIEKTRCCFRVAAILTCPCIIPSIIFSCWGSSNYAAGVRANKNLFFAKLNEKATEADYQNISNAAARADRAIKAQNEEARAAAEEEQGRIAAARDSARQATAFAQENLFLLRQLVAASAGNPLMLPPDDTSPSPRIVRPVPLRIS
jgi:hypothetical protein